MKKFFTGKHFETGESIRIETEDGWIRSIEPCSEESDHYIAPGLIDIQVNGYAGIGFTQADLSVDDIREVVKKMMEIGVTTFLPTLITAPEKVLIRNLQIIDEACRTDSLVANCIAGIHIEGPYISRLDGFRGAHNLEWVRPPDLVEFKRLIDASGGRISLLSLAPELDGARDLIAYCRANDIRVGLAHHNASAQQIHDAVASGAGLAVHLGNGIANMLSRHQNPIWPQLANEVLMISIIADGFHLTADEIMAFYKIKGPDQLILTSDCTDLAGLEPGPYHWDGKDVVLEPEGVIRFPAQNVLAGAASPLIRDIGVMIKTVQCSIGQAIRMTTSNPSKLLHLSDIGKLAPGTIADFIQFDWSGQEIHLVQCIKNGYLS